MLQTVAVWCKRTSHICHLGRSHRCLRRNTCGSLSKLSVFAESNSGNCAPAACNCAPCRCTIMCCSCSLHCQNLVRGPSVGPWNSFCKLCWYWATALPNHLRDKLSAKATKGNILLISFLALHLLNLPSGQLLAGDGCASHNSYQCMVELCTDRCLSDPGHQHQRLPFPVCQ